MKKFRVAIEAIVYDEIEVEAMDEDEAGDEAYRILEQEYDNVSIVDIIDLDKEE